MRIFKKLSQVPTEIKSTNLIASKFVFYSWLTHEIDQLVKFSHIFFNTKSVSRVDVNNRGDVSKDDFEWLFLFILFNFSPLLPIHTEIKVLFQWRWKSIFLFSSSSIKKFNSTHIHSNFSLKSSSTKGFTGLRNLNPKEKDWKKQRSERKSFQKIFNLVFFQSFFQGFLPPLDTFLLFIS